jgi:methylated-DNA-[protein]-cysteine S-methyltransferase
MNANDLKRLAPATSASARARQAAVSIGDLAADRGLLDVAVGTLGSPIGDLLIAVTPRGLARVAFDIEPRDEVLGDLADKVSPRILESPSGTQAWRRELDEYFDRARTRFDLRIDRRLLSPFAREVLAGAVRVPFGHTTTYGELAEHIGHPRAARAVGTALGSNPIPIVLPCHRVLRAGGQLGGYAGGLNRKTILLALEGASSLGS